MRHPRARVAKLSVDPRTGRVRLTIPPRASLRSALDWAGNHQGWVESQRAKLPTPMPYEPGGQIPLMGEQVVIDWVAERSRTPELAAGRLRCGGPREGLERRIERWIKREALALLSVETAEFALKAGVTIASVGVGDARGRWGSCAASGAIRYSWRLILAPAWVRRATVAHEVAHRVHMNHGPCFHALVAELLGEDPSPARAWLRANGPALHWVGRSG